MTERTRSDVSVNPAFSYRDAALGYTLATGRLYCDYSKFHEFAEKLMGHPIMTHEFASRSFWDDMRTVFEQQYILAAEADGATERTPE